MIIRTTLMWLLSVCALCSYSQQSWAQNSAANGEVTVIETGGQTMYRYRDANGQLVLQDQPPPGYVFPEDLAPPVEEAPKTPVEPTAPVGVQPLPVKSAPSALSLAALAAFAVACVFGAALLLGLPLWQRWRTETPLARVLREAGYAAFFDVAVNAGPRLQTQIDCLACTPSGILVIGEIAHRGEIHAPVDAPDWQLAYRGEQQSIANPLRKNNHDVDAVAQLLGDVALHGRVVCSSNATIASGGDARVQRLIAFKQHLGHFANANVEERTLQGAWRTLMRCPRSNNTRPRPLGVGWQGWLRRHWRGLAAAVLLLFSLCALTAVWLL